MYIFYSRITDIYERIKIFLFSRGIKAFLHDFAMLVTYIKLIKNHYRGFNDCIHKFQYFFKSRDPG